MNKYKNQSAIFNGAVHKDKKIVIVGAGGVGSTSCYYIAQMGCQNITVIDFDDVEIHNTASQFYKESDVGKSKVEALQENVKSFTGVEIVAINDHYTKEYIEGAEIVICAADDMEVRKQVMLDCIEYDVPNMIETRMAGELFYIYVFQPLLDKQKRLATRYSDEDAEPEVCSAKSISYNTGAIGATVAKQTKELLLGNPVLFGMINENIINITPIF